MMISAAQVLEEERETKAVCDRILLVFFFSAKLSPYRCFYFEEYQPGPSGNFEMAVCVRLLSAASQRKAGGV